MPSELWIDLKTRWEALCSMLGDATIAGLCEAVHLPSLGAGARGRLLRRKAMNTMYRHWRSARSHGLRATPEHVERFIRDTYDVPGELPPIPDGSTYNMAHFEIIFGGVATYLIAQGKVSFTPPA